MKRARIRARAASRRPETVELRERGLSTRAIAETLEVSQTAVVRDLRLAGVDTPKQIFGRDGRTYRWPP